MGAPERPGGDGSPGEVFAVALRLGLTSFGGPIAHLGYFERAYVRGLHWLTAEKFAATVSLCQLLPGPTSSQVGFLIGLERAGLSGALAAWLGFTLPAALAMFGFAVLRPANPGPWTGVILQGLMLTAVIVVAQAVWSMAQQLCPDLRRKLIALAAGVASLLLLASAFAQIAVLIAGALAGAMLFGGSTASGPAHAFPSPGSRASALALVCFGLLLIGALLSGGTSHGLLALTALFYRSGALVFGGGHVVLPLLQDALVPAWVPNQQFVAGYGFAQLMPGPLFTLAAFLGAAAAPTGAKALWAIWAVIAIFLPGILLSLAGGAVWEKVMRSRRARGALLGINAAVVGILGAALYRPVITTAVHGVADALLALVGLAFLQKYRIPPIGVAAGCVGVETLRYIMG